MTTKVKHGLKHNKMSWTIWALFFLTCATTAQVPTANSVVPHLVNYTGVAKDETGNLMKGVIGATFAVYSEQEQGPALWMETQNIVVGAGGKFTVTLGSTTPAGLPQDVFSGGQARWLGIAFNGGAEQPRVSLVSVPYALQAGDAQTLGGLPPSAFVLATSAANTAATALPTSSEAKPSTSVAENTNLPPAIFDVTTTGGTVGTIAAFSSSTNIQSSILSQVGTTSINVSGRLNLPATGTATATAGKNSRPADLVASAFNSGTAEAVAETFQLQAEPAGNNTTSPSGTLNFLFGSGANPPAETGLKISSAGLFTFAPGQTFPGTGTITGVTTASGSGLTGGGTSGTLTLGLTTTCSKNQVLQWNATTWVCSSAGTGTGTVTSVGLAAPTTDFTVSGSPVTGAGTLKLAWNVAPTTADIANAIVKRDAAGSFNTTSITGTGTFSTTTANVNAITGSTSLDGGSAIVGSATATGGNNRVYGVTGSSVSTVAGSTGVLGLDGNTNASETGGFTMGLQGYSSNQVNGIGVLGLDGTGLSGVFNTLRSYLAGAGVWGDGGNGGTFGNLGVTGTVDDGVAGFFGNNSPSSYDALDVYAYDASSTPFYVENVATAHSCYVDSSGSLNCTGSKNAVVPLDGGKRIVAMSAIEAPQNWFEDAGEAQLVKGVAAVQLDSGYTQTVNTDVKYQVFLTPYGDCKGLYVSNRTANSFEVHELGGGAATLSFAYRIMALRKNYENVRFADHTHDLDGHKRMLERMKARATHLPPSAIAKP